MVSPEEKDKLMWNLSKDGCFSVKSLYGVLEGRREGLFPRKMIWNSCLHTKVSSFHLGSLVRQSDKKIWWGKILTMDQLKKRIDSSPIDAPYAVGMKRALITCCSTAGRLENYGPSCFYFWNRLGHSLLC